MKLAVFILDNDLCFHALQLSHSHSHIPRAHKLDYIQKFYYLRPRECNYIFYLQVRENGGDKMTQTEPHPGHEHHLCAIVEATGLTKEMKPLIKNAKYVCTCCARAAAKKENLCEPESL